MCKEPVGLENFYVMAYRRTLQYKGKVSPAVFAWLWSNVFIGDICSPGQHYFLVGDGYFAMVAQVAVTMKRRAEKGHEIGNLAAVIDKIFQEAAGGEHGAYIIQQQPYRNS